MVRSSLMLTLPALVSVVSAACPIVQDGRVPINMTLQALDTASSPFNTQFVKGGNLSFSDLARFPCSTAAITSNAGAGSVMTPECPASRFGNASTKSIEVTISDQSIFVPGAMAKPQVGFRRAELLLKANDGADDSVRGKRVYHWSVTRDQTRPLNLSHDYLSAFHELSDSSARQWEVRIGTTIGDATERGKDESINWRFSGRDGKILWQTASVESGFQNFAVAMDYEANTLQLWYSAAEEVLRPVSDVVVNDNQGGGQWHLGLVKHPTETKSVVYDGYQEGGIDEGLVYAGIFVEDGANACITT